jgi:hypothetical protein
MAMILTSQSTELITTAQLLGEEPEETPEQESARRVKEGERKLKQMLAKRAKALAKGK